jgi:hypothetical protein
VLATKRLVLERVTDLVRVLELRNLRGLKRLNRGWTLDVTLRVLAYSYPVVG